VVGARSRWLLSGLSALTATVVVFLATASLSNPAYDRTRLDVVCAELARETGRPVSARLAPADGALNLEITYVPGEREYWSEGECQRQMAQLMEMAVVRYVGFVHSIAVVARPPETLLLVGGVPAERRLSSTVDRLRRRLGRERILALGDNHWPVVEPYRPWKYVMIHHSASPYGTPEGIDEWHRRKRHWEQGLGYDFVIGNGNGMGDGEIHASRRWTEQLEGAHAGVREYNERAVGICLIGDFASDREMAKHGLKRLHREGASRPTARQMESLRLLTLYLLLKLDLGAGCVIGHRAVRDTICPGELFPMRQFLAETRRDLARLRTSPQ